MRVYDRLISLGLNCEISFQPKMTLGQASCLTLALTHEKRGFRFVRSARHAHPVL